MVRKVALISLAIVLLFGGLISVASAAPNTANTSQKGSLLVFPKIVTGDFQDTYIYMANDYPRDVWVKCYWMYDNQDVQDFIFRLTPNQPIAFSAAYGQDLDYKGVVTVPPFSGKGSLQCWAISDASAEEQLSFNHLYGSAWLYDSRSPAANGANVIYNAWSFTAKFPFNTSIPSGQLKLDGAQYDACPTYLVANFTPGNSDGYTPFTYPDLTLWPCKQDLRQDRRPTCTKAKFDVWNANETKFTGAYQCLRCWYEGILENIDKPSGYGGDKFNLSSLKTFAARFRVQSANNSACRNGVPGCEKPAPGLPDPNPGVLTPFIGLVLYDYDLTQGSATANYSHVAGFTPHTAGLDNTGLIQWDVDSGVQEVSGK